MGVTVELIPCSENAFTEVARRILDHHHTSLPDLTDCRILLANLNSAPALRRALLIQAEQAGHQALLGPSIQTMNEWLSDQSLLPQPVLSQAAQELVLVDAIRHTKNLFDSHDPWLLSSELSGLFTELTLARVPLKSQQQFKVLLREGYGIDKDEPLPFMDEARIVFTLWKAWHQQLRDDHVMDAATAQLMRQAQSLEAPDQQDALWIIGFEPQAVTAIDWLQQLLLQGKTRLLLQASITQINNNPAHPYARLIQQLDAQIQQSDQPPSAFSQLLDTVFANHTQPLHERAHAFSSQHSDSPLTNRLTTLHTQSAEQEAEAVVLQLRRWLLEDKHSIGIISEDRRLARRIRALLEREGLALQDAGGWALSTTSSAAVLERWLQTVEEDFAHTPLLDVLKSPFVCLAENRRAHLQNVRRFEQDIVFHEQIARGLERYRRHLNLRAARLPDWSETSRHDIEHMLNRLDHAAEPLRELLHDEHPVAAFTTAVMQSLQELGIDLLLATDPAGQRVLDELQSLHTAAEESHTRLRWEEFRGWLGRTLERFTFQPATSQSAIQLMTLAQCAMQQFDAVIIAGCTADLLPGKAAGQAFFNQSVRAELGLPTWRDTLNIKLHQFRCTLEAAPQILLTCCDEIKAEPVTASPWLELLETFHSIAYGTALHDDQLEQLIRALRQHPGLNLSQQNISSTKRPAPAITAALLPKDWTASTHQRLIDCPYRFFAADILHLSAPEEIREALEKSDYGEYVHRILQAFHGNIKELPGPWQGQLTGNERDAAIQLLQQISQAVFQNAISDNLAARGWLKRWLACIPAYIDWCIERNAHWQPQLVEQRMQREILPGITLKGRVDRIDRCGDQQAILDYKTGKTADIDAVFEGEAVQLPSYALLSESDVSRVEYVQFDKNKVHNKVCLEDDELRQLTVNIKQRLLQMTRDIGEGQALHAWGDPDVCRYCEFDGICRRDSWQDHDR